MIKYSETLDELCKDKKCFNDHRVCPSLTISVESNVSFSIVLFCPLPRIAVHRFFDFLICREKLWCSITLTFEPFIIIVVIFTKRWSNRSITETVFILYVVFVALGFEQLFYPFATKFLWELFYWDLSKIFLLMRVFHRAIKIKQSHILVLYVT